MKIWIEHDISGNVFIHTNEPKTMCEGGWVYEGDCDSWGLIDDRDLIEWAQGKIPLGQLAEFELVCHWEAND